MSLAMWWGQVSSLLTNGAACKQTDNSNYKVLQAFGGHGHWARAPSPAELRCMTYLGLQHGATLPSPSAACALKEHTARGQPQASSQVSRKRGGP